MLTEKELYNRLTDLESQKLTLSSDIAQLKKDVKYHEDENPKGLAAEDIKSVHGASKLKAKLDYLEKREAAQAIFSKYEELETYNED